MQGWLWWAHTQGLQRANVASPISTPCMAAVRGSQASFSAVRIASTSRCPGVRLRQSAPVCVSAAVSMPSRGLSAQACWRSRRLDQAGQATASDRA